MKKCSKCKLEKNLSDFGVRTSTKDKLRYQCKDCDSLYSLKRYKEGSTFNQKMKKVNPFFETEKLLKKRYNMSLSEYNKMVEDVEGKCEICGTDEPGGVYQKLQIDHCHETNKVRGLLCVRCNQGIGQLKHNVTILKNAIKYLSK